MEMVYSVKYSWINPLIETLNSYKQTNIVDSIIDIHA